ncbi:MAG: M20/M25/M40 family metallo-hydrolase, partial [Planctomycetes bacterium]|nr:M20/M25/M40 family metallo-hydrolase [Planctomycetota bacterium]
HKGVIRWRRHARGRAGHSSRPVAAGVPSVVFGPGSIEQAHTADEWISLDQLRQATEIIHRFCLSFS